MTSEADVSRVSEIFEQLTGSASKGPVQKKAAEELAAFVCANPVRLVRCLRFSLSCPDRFHVTSPRISLPHLSTKALSLPALVAFIALFNCRKGSLLAISLLPGKVGKTVEPFLLPLLPLLLEKMSDKVAAVRKVAQEAGLAVVGLISPLTLSLILPDLYLAMDGKSKWQTQQGACMLLKSLVPKCSQQVLCSALFTCSFTYISLKSYRM